MLLPTDAPLALPPPDALVVVVVEGVDVEVDEVGSSTVSIDTAVPEAQFTGEPPTACQVSPVT